MSNVPVVIIGIFLITSIFVLLFTRGEENNPLAALGTQTPTPTQVILNETLNQSTPAPTASPSLSIEIPNATEATITTSKGAITIEFYQDVAPNTVKNFITKAVTGYYNNLTFHRVEDWVVQGGDPQGTGTGGGDMPTELSDKPFARGSLGIARTPADVRVSNDSQFFITKTASPHLNGQYTNFGIVREGMDVVDKLERGDTILSITLN